MAYKWFRYDESKEKPLSVKPIQTNPHDISYKEDKQLYIKLASNIHPDMKFLTLCKQFQDQRLINLYCMIGSKSC